MNTYPKGTEFTYESISYIVVENIEEEGEEFIVIDVKIDPDFVSSDVMRLEDFDKYVQEGKYIITTWKT